ncbi:protein CLT2, chloroplastic isoform X1 [Rhodamnia argentea]|uniref:Protein CLT2, chloroplastic isoform X1 n=2 Tax=Rhodamnia argentea TaxID=178133 RepID=A0A8B8P1W1_9MYRT|nr:protein CLT2, chloroplastic isoform X1 [Rhodamnia argentea]
MGFPYSASLPSSPSHLLHGSNHHSLLVMSSIRLPLNLRLSSNLLPKLPPLQTHPNVARLPRASAAKFQVRASGGDAPPAPSDGKLAILGSAAVTVAFAVANRVLYKLALVPMKQYPFFLAQVTTFGYVAIYFSILYIRNRVGIVSGEMLALPKWRFVAIGMLEALGVVSGMSAGAMLPGPAIPILSQTFLVWQLTFSTVLLGRKYSFNQIAGCLLVAAGVVVAVASGSNSGQSLSGIDFAWPLVMIASSAFQAGASIIKESVFIDAARRLKGKSLDIFVVNSFGSGFQALFVFLFLPFLSNLKGIPFAQLPLYLKEGAGCFLNIGANTTGCDGAPWLPLIFVTTNIIFNISLLNLVKMSSAVVASLAVMLSVPISIYVLSRPLPYLPEGVSLSPFFVIGGIILVLGLILYNVPQRQAAKSD